MLNEPILVTIKYKEGDQDKSQDFKCEGFTGRIQEQFARYMQKHDLDIIKASRDVVGETDYYALLQRHLQEVKAGKLDFGSERFCDFMEDDENVTQLLWWCFSAAGNGIDRGLVKYWVQNERKEAAELFDRLYSEKKV